ncbi:unnamed protein product [Allacma fusca]|uniref:Tr-type G domain-containing protein n=1 Tax=Allacma fusca TaxID=39272 RepID=A0A8J2PS11_9HEXA|nr:unnamed protein product [Allacma fusca]
MDSTRKIFWPIFFWKLERNILSNLTLRTFKRNYAVSTFKPHSKGKKLNEATEKLRNVGIMAHIDAGKTTTTERMLYYAGVIKFPGEVHHGDTVTDFLPLERERGITIQSAVVSFPWKEFSINLIDTPGHVDFTYEVERSLRAVDSAVAILDASAGVEAQTLTVWRQAMENKLPRLIYINKMDKAKASYQMCLESIIKRLHSIPVLLQLPVYNESMGGTGSSFVGIIDLVRMEKIIFDAPSKGVTYQRHCIRNDKDLMKKRCELVEQVSDFDSDLATKIIETESIGSVTNEDLQSAIKRITLNSQIVPVFLGSSFKNVGVQPLLDAVTTYLPHPCELPVRDKVVSSYNQELCAFAFKTLYDNHLGVLTFMRLFQGSLKTGSKIYNVSREKHEKVSKVYQPLADDLHEVQEMFPGQVAVVSGLKETYTGDTLTTSTSVASSARRKLAKVSNREDVKAVLTSVEIPEPVFFCSIEPASLLHQKLLDQALNILQREDPSLHVSVDPDTSQTVLSGMGELHLEIIHQRLTSEFKVDADLGKLSVAYKETTLEPVTKRITFERCLNNKNHIVTIELTLQYKEKPSEKVRHGLGKETQENLARLSEKHERCIQNGVQSSLRCGPKLGFPVINVEVSLNWFQTTKFTSDTIVEAAAASCVRQALQETPVVLLEPLVTLEIIVDAKYQTQVSDDLNRRRFQLEVMDQKHGNKILIGLAPLGELLGYATALRTLSSGLGTFSLQFSHYQKVVNPYDEDKIAKQVRGF